MKEMQKLGTDASLHPKTVTKVSKGKKIKRRTPAASNRQRALVSVQRMDQRVWKAALKVAKGDTTRIQRISSECVIVHNPGVNWS